MKAFKVSNADSDGIPQMQASSNANSAPMKASHNAYSDGIPPMKASSNTNSDGIPLMVFLHPNFDAPRIHRVPKS
jgi:hypothetical protein